MDNIKLYRIALIGRTNVGKSTLFNRISKTRDALTFDRPGVTRDAKEKVVDIWGKKATIIDAPGMFDYAECDNKPELMNAITAKLDEIIKTSDLVLFVIDGVIGVTQYDKEISKILRKNGKKVITVVNKGEKKIADMAYADAMEFGFDDVVQISAEHGVGMNELFELIYPLLPLEEKIEDEDEDDDTIQDEEIIKLALVGRPNVGKSTMVNKILGEEKQLVADFAGLTRESSESDFELNGRKIKIIDTPGIRRKSRVCDILEKISVSNTRKSYKRADAVILLIDAASLEVGEIEKQDLTLASNIIKEGKALVVAFNKYDKTPYNKNDIPEFLKRNFARSFSQLKEVPFLFVSALNGVNINKMMETVISAYDKQKKRISTSKLNDWISDVNQTDLMQSGSARFKLNYMTQIGSNPPAFLVFVSNKDNMRADHERFITNNFKDTFGLKDVAVKIIFRQKSDRRKK